MAESIHEKLKRVRRPRVHITYEVETEGAQIERHGGRQALVSLSDHDDIRAPWALARGGTDCPISLEWTVPFGPGFFHLGVHNLPASRSADIAARLCAFAPG